MSNKAYEVVTEKILSIIDRGVIPWRKPWSSSPAAMLPQISGKTSHEYQGCNQFLLTVVSMAEGFTSNKWLTFKQVTELGGNVRKGSKGTPIVYYGQWSPKGDSGEVSSDKDGNPVRVGFLRFYYGFNASQCDNLPAKFTDTLLPVEKRSDAQKIEACEAIAAKYTDCPVVAHGNARAFYRPLADEIHMPNIDTFVNDESYYAALFHEMAHSTGHAKRLARKEICEFGVFGSESYAKEELVAELAASFLCRDAGIDKPDLVEQSASYLDGWRKAIKGDVKLVVGAAAAAQRAANWISGKAGQENQASDAIETASVPELAAC